MQAVRNLRTARRSGATPIVGRISRTAVDARNARNRVQQETSWQEEGERRPNTAESSIGLPQPACTGK